MLKLKLFCYNIFSRDKSRLYHQEKVVCKMKSIYKTKKHINKEEIGKWRNKKEYKIIIKNNKEKIGNKNMINAGNHKV